MVKFPGLSSNPYLPGYDFTASYLNHPFPITIIMGDRDLIDFGGKLYEKWLVSFPNIERILIKNAGHDAWVDQPDQFKELSLEL